MELNLLVGLHVGLLVVVRLLHVEHGVGDGLFGAVGVVRVTLEHCRSC